MFSRVRCDREEAQTPFIPGFATGESGRRRRGIRQVPAMQPNNRKAAQMLSQAQPQNPK